MSERSGVPDARNEVPDYPAAVRRLTAENRRLRVELAERDAARRHETRKLEAKLREGLTPELTVLKRELARWRLRALAAEGRLTELRRNAR